MGRVKRIQNIGMHYISNRTVELRNSFIVKEDYQAFIEYLCSLSSLYEFTIHSYVLLPHSYHLLLETKKENISVIMKLLGSQYGQYFNLKYGRNGALWEGRYKSSFMQDKNYVFYFLAYMENLPKITGITSELRSYNYTTYRQFIGLDECLDCVKSSIVFQRFNTIEEIKFFFTEIRNKEFIDNIIEILRKKNLKQSKDKSPPKELKLERYFFLNQSKEETNENIIRALKDGASQTQIGDFLKISQQAVSLRIKKYRQKNRKEQ